MSRKWIFIAVLLAGAVACTHFARRSDWRPSRGPAAVPGVPMLKDFQPDPKLKTVCAMTMNSQEELEAFKEGLSPKQFQFVELVDAKDSGWLDKACAAPIQCDLLIVSAHFGGNFFGEHGKLQTSKLEQLTCDKACGNILQAPQEVFMFGCNTLSGKKKDFRTREEYVTALIEHGLGEQQAQMVAAYRYSPIGSSNEDRMRRIFKEVPNIYGFNSSAPKGVNVKHMLKAYLERTGDYVSHMTKTAGKENPTLSRALMLTHFHMAHGDRKTTSPACFLDSKKVATNSKIEWIEKTLNSDSAMENVPYIYDYLKKLRPLPLGRSDLRAIISSRIQDLQDLKQEIIGLIDSQLEDFLSVQVQLANFAKLVGWLDEKEYREKITRKILNPRESFSYIATDFICGMDLQLQLSESDVPETWWSQRDFLRALECMRVEEPWIQQRVIGSAKEGDYDTRARAIRLLGTMNDSSGQIAKFFLNLVKEDSSGVFKFLAFQELNQLPGKSEDTWAEMLNIVSSHEEAWVRGLAAGWIHFAQLQDRKLRTQILQSLIKALNLDETIRPPKVTPYLIDSGAAISGGNPVIKPELAERVYIRALGSTFFIDDLFKDLSDIHLYGLAQMIANSKFEAGLVNASDILLTFNLSSEQGLEVLLNTMNSRSSDSFHRSWAVKALRGSREQDRILSALRTNLQTDPDPKVREEIAMVLLPVIRLRPDLVSEWIVNYQREPVLEVRSNILFGITNTGVQRPEIYHLLVGRLRSDAPEREKLLVSSALKNLGYRELEAWKLIAEGAKHAKDDMAQQSYVNLLEDGYTKQPELSRETLTWISNSSSYGERWREKAREALKRLGTE